MKRRSLLILSMGNWMTSFERRQRIIDLLREQPGIKVTELAPRLAVSEGTIRNDLRSLEKAGRLTRVRGGAVIRDEQRHFMSVSFAARVHKHADAKNWIGRRAAEMVEDGDSILLDASSTVFAMVPYLQERRNLRIVTNGLEVGLALAKNRTHSVILVGGTISSRGTSVVGHLGNSLLEQLHIETAFVSCSGLTVDHGLTEVHIEEAQRKRKMIESAGRLVALADSSKVGRVDLTSFASIGQVSHLFTDRDITQDDLDQLRDACIPITVCDRDTASTLNPCDQETEHYRIGFANLGESMPFAVDVRRGLEFAARAASNIDLVIADNELSGEVALRVADRLVAENVDLVIEYQIEEKVGSLIVDKYSQAGIPIIAVDIPMVGATFFGVDNYRAGYMAGAALGRWIQSRWDGELDRLLVLEEQRAGSLPAARIQGQLDGLREMVGQIPADKISTIDSGNTSEISEANVLETLARFPNLHRFAVISFNDDAAFGALCAARQAGREQEVVIVGQGADRIIRKEIGRPDSRLIGSTAYWPERYGEKLIPLAIKILNGEPVPPAVHTEHIFLDVDNIETYYPH